MHVDDERVALGRVEIGRVDQPALDVITVALPLQADALAPGRAHGGIAAGDRTPLAERAGKDFRRRAEARADDGRSLAVRRNRGVDAPAAGRDRFRSAPGGRHLLGRRVQTLDGGIAADDRADQDLAAADPAQRTRRGLDTRCQVLGRAAGSGHRVDIAAHRALVAHQPFDEGDVLTVRRVGRGSNLQRGLVDEHRLTATEVLAVKRRAPPVVVTVAAGRDQRDVLAFRGPRVLVDVEIIGRDRTDPAVRLADQRETLLEGDVFDLAGLVCRRGQWPQLAVGVLGIEHAKPGAIRCPRQAGEHTVGVRQPAGRAAIRRHQIDVAVVGFGGIGQERDPLAVG